MGITYFKAHPERLGSAFVLASGVVWALFPVLVQRGTQVISPFTFAAFSVSIATIGNFFYLFTQPKFNVLKFKQAFFPILMVALLVIVTPYSLFFLGAQHTSGVNTTMLLSSEIIFTLIFTPWFGEPTTRIKVLGAAGIFFGVVFILYNGNAQLNFGDWLIILSTLTYPLGNFYSKRALTLVSPAIILFVRHAIASVFLIGLALWLEPADFTLSTFKQFWLILTVNGIVVLMVSKILWYQGFKYLDISKAISLGSIFPLYSIIYLLLLGEHITLYQWFGIGLILAGAFIALKRSSVPLEQTRYGNHLASS